MLTRLHKILIGIFVAQLALAIAMFVGADESAAARETPILSGFDAAKVTRVQISAPGKPAVDLVKRGEAWVLASSFDYPVDATKLNDLLTPLAKMAAAAPIATQESRHKQLRVGDDEHERKLTLTADGKDTVLYVGASAGTRRTAVRRAGEARVWAAQGVSAYAAGVEPTQWIDTAYIRVPRDEVAKVAIDRGGKRIELARSDATWTVALDGAPVALTTGEALDTDAIDRVVSAATTIDVSKPADPKRDASAPMATVTIERKAGDNASAAAVVIDIVADGEHYWVRQRGLERAALVDKARLASIVDVTRDTIIKKPAAPQPSEKP